MPGAPRLRRGLLQQRRIVLRVSRNTKHWEGSKLPRGSFPPWSFLPMGIGERPFRWFTRLLAISSPSTVFPTCGYRGGDAAEQDQSQKPIYFVSKALQGAETRYQALDKAALAVVFSARRLRHYFNSFTVVVMTNLPIQKVL